MSFVRRVMGSEIRQVPEAVPSMPSRRPIRVIVPVRAVDDHARAALGTAWSMMSARQLVAVHVCDGPDAGREFARRWQRWEPGVPLVMLAPVPTDGDPVAASIADYVSRRRAAHETVVVLTEAPVPSETIGRRPGTGRCDALEAALIHLPGVVVCRQRLTGATNTGAAPAARS